MLDKKYIDLINKEIDGFITQDEKDDLLNHLKENEEAQQYYSEMIRTDDLLSNVKNIYPSPNLKKRVLNSLDTELYKNVKKESFIKSIIPNKLFQPKLRLAFTFALGVVAGLLLYSAFFTNIYQQEPINATDLYGTIGISKNVVENINVELLEINGSISLNRINNLFLLENNFNSVDEFLVKYQFNPKQVTFFNFSPLDSEPYSIKKGNKFFQTFCSGDNNFKINFKLLSQEGSYITVKLLQSGKLLFEKEIRLFHKK